MDNNVKKYVFNFRVKRRKPWDIEKSRLAEYSKKRMGLEGSELMEKMEVIDSSRWNLPQAPNPLSSCGLNSCLPGDLFLNEDPNCQKQLLLQAQLLLEKSILYQKLEQTLQLSPAFRPNTYGFESTSSDPDCVTSVHRDAAVNNIRFCNVFYGFKPSTFALAVNLLDRILGKVKTHPRYLSCIATCCFHIAALTQEELVFIPSHAELVKLTQCGGTENDLQRMENLICQKLQWELDAITPLTFLQYFYEMFTLKDKVADPSTLNSLIAKLQVLLCQHQFSFFRAEIVALALISHYLKDRKDTSAEQLSLLVELQYYCQIPDLELNQCCGLITEYLVAYGNQRSRQPRLQLTWTVSRRTLTKLRPSSRVELNLEPIMEDEGLLDSDDAGPFDSENDDVEIKQNKLKICPYFPCIEPDDPADSEDSLLSGYEDDDEDSMLSFTLHSNENHLIEGYTEQTSHQQQK